MMNSKQIFEELTNVRNARKEAISKRDALRETYIYEETLAIKAEKRKAVANEFNQNEEVIFNCDLKLAILKHNYILAVFEEAKPVIISVLTKYENKPYGEKTKQKIAEEVKSLCGCRFYINREYMADAYLIYNDNISDDIVCWGNKQGDNKLLTEDNKIIVVSDFKPVFINNEFVEDVDTRICELKSIHDKAETIQKELEKVCSQYNDLAVGTIRHISAHDTIHPWLI